MSSRFSEKSEPTPRWVPWVVVGLLGMEALILFLRISYAPLHHDEGLAAILGEETLRGILSGAGAQHTGSVLVHPLLAAAGDQMAGLTGVRGVSLFFGLLLSLMVYAAAATLFGRIPGVLALGLFVLQGPVLHISKMGLYDVVSDTFLAAAFALLTWEGSRKTLGNGIPLLCGAVIFLVLAAMSKYVTAVYLPLAAVYLLYRYPLSKSALPLGIEGGLIFLYGLYALEPVLGPVIEQGAGVVARGEAGFSRAAIGEILFQWLWLPALMGFIGLCFAERRRETAALLLAASPLVLIHLFSGGEQGLQKNVVQPMIFLSPAAGWALWRASEPFRWAAGFNLLWLPHAALSLLLGTAALSNLKWLERSYPDYGPAVAYLLPRVTPQTPMVADADFLLKYALKTPEGPIVPPYAVHYRGLSGMEGAAAYLRDGGPEYVILDGYYGARDRRQTMEAAMSGRYTRVFSSRERLSWGEVDLKIYERRPEQ